MLRVLIICGCCKKNVQEYWHKVTLVCFVKWFRFESAFKGRECIFYIILAHFYHIHLLFYFIFFATVLVNKVSVRTAFLRLCVWTSVDAVFSCRARLLACVVVVGTLFNRSSGGWFHVYCYGSRDVTRSWFGFFRSHSIVKNLLQPAVKPDANYDMILLL